MGTLRRIIVGYNFFPDGDPALQSSRILAERSDAALCLVHIVEPALVQTWRRSDMSARCLCLKKLLLRCSKVATLTMKSSPFVFAGT
jgi:hypothetical protein